MLYVFHVDCGRMMKFDMNIALSKVEHLKHTIELLHGYSAAHQVLLVSGGEMLQPGSMVCSYSAGTDTNPIYMFTTEDPVDSKNNKIPWPSIEPIILDVDLKDQVEKCLALPATYSTVVQRAQLAQQIFDLAREEESTCERLVHEQHLQQQGWSAVIANMEDLVSDFKERYKHFTDAFSVYMGQRGSLRDTLKTFETDIEVLGRIPVLPGLLKDIEYESHGFDEISAQDVISGGGKSEHEIKDDQLLVVARENDAVKSQEVEATNSELERVDKQSEKLRNQISLLHWMSLKDNHLALKTMSDECLRGMETLDDRKVQALNTDICNILRMAEQEEIKEIKGLEDRLCGLEKLMFDLKKMVQEQRELATAFQQNQNRASNLGDPSILPDLCASHRSQLLVMLQSQKMIRDIRRRISKAKEELSDNLYKRLKYIVTIENTMLDLANKMLFYHRYLRRIDNHLSVIRQIHEAPTIYVTAVIEVVRRRLYSTAFNSWASTLASDLLSIYKNEITRRQEFDTLFRGHFLGSLFPGLTDMPPDFATEIPATFDECLPDLTKNDVETLSIYLPESTSNLTLSCIKPVIEFFNSRSGNRNTHEKSSLSGKLQSIGGAQVLPRPIDIYSHLKDGFESETDTEEFVKVGQSPNERKLSTEATAITIATSTSQLKIETVTISTTTEPIETHSAETLTEDNLGSTTLEVERLKNLLKSMAQLSLDALGLLKSQMQYARSEAESYKLQMQDEVQKLAQRWSTIQTNYETREAEKTRNMQEQQETAVNELQSILSAKQDEFANLQSEYKDLETKYTTTTSDLETKQQSLSDDVASLNVKIAELEAKLQNAAIEKERAVTECRERMLHEHKTEIESLRCRFKLMTNMERSPSDLSLEKIERPDIIEISSHESIIQQLREDFENEKQLAIEAAVECERSKWVDECEKLRSTGASSLDSDILRQIIVAKELQLDLTRERDEVLSKENAQLKLKIEALTSEEESDFKDQIEFMRRQKDIIQQELSKEKLRRLEMESSMKLCTCRDLKMTTSLTKSSQSPLKLGVQIDSCNRGDAVFIVWNYRHGQYIIVQESSTLYFLHGDSHSALNLKAPSSTVSDFPEPYYSVGRVVDKEYCHARKDENRYKVSKGTKFYRVKVQPIIRSESVRHSRRERNESTSSASSVAVSRSTSTQHLIDSFAQTDTSGICSGRDMTDSIDVRDRTISVTEEDEEHLSSLGDRYRCVSYSEEEERTLEAISSPVVTNLSTSQNTTNRSIGIFATLKLIEPLNHFYRQ